MEHSYTQTDIDKYLRKEMSQQAQKAFEAILATNQDLQNRVAETQLLRASLQSLAETTFIQDLQAHQQTLSEKGFFLDDTDLDEFLMQRSAKEEAQKIQQKIATDKQFESDYEARKQLKESLTILEENRVIDLIKEVGASSVTEEKVLPIKKSPLKVRSLRNILSIAAAFALLILGIWWMYPKPVTSNTLYASNFKLLENQKAYPYLRRESMGKLLYHFNLEKADDAYYIDKNYSTAIVFFEKYFADAPADDGFITNATLHYASALMKENDHKKASDILLPIFEQTKNEQAGWYLALCYLKMGALEKIAPIIEKMPSGSNADQLSDLIKKLPDNN